MSLVLLTATRKCSVALGTVAIAVGTGPTRSASSPAPIRSGMLGDLDAVGVVLVNEGSGAGAEVVAFGASVLVSGIGTRVATDGCAEEELVLLLLTASATLLLG